MRRMFFSRLNLLCKLQAPGYDILPGGRCCKAMLGVCLLCQLSLISVLIRRSIAVLPQQHVVRSNPGDSVQSARPGWQVRL